MSDLMYSLGEDNYGWSPAFQDYKQILEQLRSKDEMVIYEAIMSLQNQLSVAQENTLTNFTLDQYIPALIDILKRPPLSDISNEINMFAIQCLTNLMDIFPTICNTLVNHGAVKCFSDVLERSMGFIDLNEACIKGLEKISIENPYAILTSGAMGLCLNMMDFFENTTQKRIVSILLNISRHSASEQDLNDFLIPIVPCLCNLLQMRGDQAQPKIEIISTTILRICESIVRFINPHSQYEKLSQSFENLGNTGVVDAVLQSLQDYCIFDNQMKQSLEESSPSKQVQQQSVQKIMTNPTIQNYLKVLSLCSKFSVNLTKMILDFNIFKLIENFLPSYEDLKKLHFTSDQFPFILETITLIDSLFPEREDQFIQTENPNEKARFNLENLKREIYLSIDQQRVAYVAEKILPKIFYVYENNIQSSIRAKALQIIDKLILLFNDELLNNFIEPYSFAKFIYTNLRSNHLQSIYLCLQMVDKLMKSNPRSYTLPLLREGVSPFIKKLASPEQLEKTLGFKLTENESLDKHEEMLAQAKTALLNRGAAADSEQKLQFEQTLQKYLEISKLSSTGQSTNKNQIQIAKSIITQAENLNTQFFENQDFLNKINECCGEEFQILISLKALSLEIIEEAKQQEFSFDKNNKLMKSLAETLTSQRHIMSYEFKESGLLEALQLYLTHTPNQVQLYCEKLKNTGEEIKHSEEIQINTMTKNARNVSKKQARCFVQRLKLFLHIILNGINNKQPIQELVNLCHDLLSQSEYLIFDNQTSSPDPGLFAAQQQIYGGLFSNQLTDPNQSMTALKQLTRRTRVNLIYDPQRAFIKKQESSNELIPEFLMNPTEIRTLQKSQSHHPAFQHLSDKVSVDQAHSKVYIKRNFLYTELKQVLISVEQCASLWLLEDFLRTKIRTGEDVKTLKTPSSFYSQMKTSSKQARVIMDKAMERMRELMESGNKGERMRTESEEFSQVLADEIVNSKDLTEQEQVEIIRQLEIQTLQLMDEFYAAGGDQDNDEAREDFEERLLSGEAEQPEDVDTEQRILEFQRTIDRLREAYRVKKEKKKQESEDNGGDTQMKEEGSEEQKKQQLPSDDVEMTDEEEEERRQIEEYNKRRQHREAGSQKEVQLTVLDEQDKEIINSDLEELIKANGDDIEYEFYYCGQYVNQNQTLFEILKNGEQQARKNPAGIHSYYQSYGSQQDQSNIYFCIKDKGDELKQSRKDSILEFSQKRERTKSEAFDDISVSSINQIVQQMIEKEFFVFNKEIQQTTQEKKQLEQALRILKVINYLCKHSNLFSGQGMKFLINSYSDEEIKDEGFTDYDLQIGLSQIHSNLFHHHKLDAYILKNIQDPYNLIGGAISDTLQQIFRNCPFLFPFQTRLLFFKLISFIGSIDMNRSIFFLRQFLKQKVGKLPEERNSVKFQRQKVKVDRTKILESAFSLVKQINKRAFLEVQYKDEQGTGLGPTLEFYYLLSQEIRNAPIWRKSMTDNTLFPSPINLTKLQTDEVTKIYEIFRVSGIMIAKSLSDDKLIDLPISPLLWELILGKKINIFDLEQIDKDLFKVFAELQLLANKRRELDKQSFLDQDSKLRQINSLKTSQGAKIEDLGLNFTLPGYEEIELKLNGKDTDVTIDNLQEYIDLTMHYLFHETVKIQVQAFKKGFNSIFPVDSLKPFATSIELEDMICGTQRNNEEWLNLTKLTENIVPAHGYHTKSTSYLNFLKFMSELDQEEKRKFLKFVTGSPRLPNGGFGSLDPKLTVVLKKPINPMENVDEILPSVMTCQNYVKLPNYTSYEVLKMKFEMAYNEGCNNFTLS